MIYTEEQKEKRRQAVRKYREKHKEELREKQREYDLTKRVRNKEADRRRNAKLRRRNKELVFNHYGRSCACCRENHEEFLTIDHILGGGNAHRKTIGNIYAWLVKNNFPPEFQILCFNCNEAKHFYGVCPHAR